MFLVQEAKDPVRKEYWLKSQNRQDFLPKRFLQTNSMVP